MELIYQQRILIQKNLHLFIEWLSFYNCGITRSIHETFERLDTDRSALPCIRNSLTLPPPYWLTKKMRHSALEIWMSLGVFERRESSSKRFIQLVLNVEAFLVEKNIGASVTEVASVGNHFQ
jgi:hypothetical protein